MIVTFFTAAILFAICLIGLCIIGWMENEDLKFKLIVDLAIVDLLLIMYVLITQGLVPWIW